MEREQEENPAWDVDVGLLIKLVQNFPHIYDHAHKSFKNNLLRENTWARIATTLEVPVDDCMRVWKNIRDKYTRERRVVMTQSPNGIPLSKWEFYDAMKFLNPYIKRRRTLRLRKKSALANNKIDANDNTGSFSSTAHSKAWDAISVKLSPESLSLLEGDFDEESQEMEEVTFDTELEDSLPRIKDVIEQPNAISIVRHQTSEEAFGAYIATRLMELPPEIRQIKKAKLFKDLEEPEEVS